MLELVTREAKAIKLTGVTEPTELMELTELVRLLEILDAVVTDEEVMFVVLLDEMLPALETLVALDMLEALLTELDEVCEGIELVNVLLWIVLAS